MSGSNLREECSSLLSFLNADGSIDLAGALKRLDEDEEVLPDDDFSILDCIGHDGAFDLVKFFRRQEEASLLELSLRADLIDNSNTTINRAERPIIQSLHALSSLERRTDGGGYTIRLTVVFDVCQIPYDECPEVP